MRNPPSNPLPSMREWVEKNLAEPRRGAQAARTRPAQPSKVFEPVTADERAAIAAIEPGRVTYLPATGTKRFARQIQGAGKLTAAQRLYLWQIVWRYRRQIKDKTLVAMARKICDGK